MKSKIYKFDPVIYPYPLLVTKEYDAAELDKIFLSITTGEELVEPGRLFHTEPFVTARTCLVCTRKEYNTYVLVLLCRPKAIGNGIITHEAYHGMNMIAERLGFLPKESMQDEPCAYLVQWIANCIGSVKENKTYLLKGELLEDE